MEVTVHVTRYLGEIRQHGGDPGGARTAGRVDHDQKLHQIVIGRLAGGLNQKRVGAADVLFELHEILAVREMSKMNLAQTDPEIIRDLLRQFRMRAPGVHTNVLCLFHLDFPCFSQFGNPSGRRKERSRNGLRHSKTPRCGGRLH